MTFGWLQSQSWFKDYIQKKHLELFQEHFMRDTFIKYLPPPPEYMGEVTGKTLFGYLRLSGYKIKRDDAVYRYTTVSEIERFLRWYYDDTEGTDEFND